MNNSANALGREKLDQYFTPEWATEVLIRERPELQQEGLHIWEPCSGRGDMARVLEEAGHEVLTTDIDPEMPAMGHLDFLSVYERPEDLDWIITNPPYNKASEIFKHATGMCDNIAMLLRLGWMEGCRDRFDFLSEMEEFIILAPRVQYNYGGANDRNNGPSVWCIWTKENRHRAPTNRWVHRDG